MIRGFLLLAGALLVLGAAIEPPSQPVVLSPAEAVKQGRELVAKILSEQPAKNLTNTGALKIRDAKGKRTEIPVWFNIIPTETNWLSAYRALNVSGSPETNIIVELAVIHANQQPNAYHLSESGWRSVDSKETLSVMAPTNTTIRDLPGNASMIPFVNSDFWLADLGLEFFHWPEQRLLRKEIRRGQSCSVLESVNPHPAPGAYSRVLSWIDIDTDGIINADAYDAQGKLLKQFAAKSFKKVHGEWELQEIEMLNRQTGSRTSIEFNLSSK